MGGLQPSLGLRTAEALVRSRPTEQYGLKTAEELAESGPQYQRVKTAEALAEGSGVVIFSVNIIIIPALNVRIQTSSSESTVYNQIFLNHAVVVVLLLFLM